ncbi:hypothetical protein BKA69DRAFT_1041421 [Paraphysoderma sedebokerense]|nr:hypothetical protein BKA69DRAFT_1041421 [Paraphysoderma sedebokerense]
MRGKSYYNLIILIWCYIIFFHFDYQQVEAIPVLSSQSQCQTTTVRKEWRDWTEGEQQRYFKALRKMNEVGSNEEGVSVLDKFTKMHAEYNSEAHTNTLFLPWHRAFLREFEKALQSIDPSLSLPYYNWAIDMSIYGSDILEQSTVMSPNAFGGTGSPLLDETGQVPIRGFEIVKGQLANWTVGYPERHLLSRELKYLETVTEEELENLILGSSDFQSFQERLDWPHAAFHQSFGADGTGDMGRLPTAPNDPIFFLHHAMIDYVSRCANNAAEVLVGHVSKSRNKHTKVSQGLKSKYDSGSVQAYDCCYPKLS